MRDELSPPPHSLPGMSSAGGHSEAAVRKPLRQGITEQSMKERRDRTTVRIRREKREQQVHKRRLLHREQLQSGDASGQAGAVVNSGSFSLAAGQSQPLAPEGRTAMVRVVAGRVFAAFPPQLTSRAAAMRGRWAPLQLMRIPEFTRKLYSSEYPDYLDALTYFRRLVSAKVDPPMEEIAAAGVIPKIVSFLANEHDIIRFEAAWVLNNLAAHSSEITLQIVRADAIPPLVSCLAAPNMELANQVVWVLGNIAGDGLHLRDMVLSTGVLSRLIPLLNPEVANPTMLSNVLWATGNLVRGSNPAPSNLTLPVLPAISRLLHHEDPATVDDACWVLHYILDGGDDEERQRKQQAVIQSGALGRVCERLVTVDGAKLPYLHVVGSTVSGGDDQTEQVLNKNCLVGLLASLGDQRRAVRKQAAWAISNIAAGNKHQVQRLVDGNFVPPLVDTLRRDVMTIRKEALWALANMLHRGTVSTVDFLVRHGVISPLLHMLVECPDVRAVLQGLNGLAVVLRTGEWLRARENMPLNRYLAFVRQAEGQSHLERLSEHSEPAVAKLATQILAMFFDISDLEDDDEEDEEAEEAAARAAGAAFVGGHVAPASHFAPGSAAGQQLPFGVSQPFPATAAQQHHAAQLQLQQQRQQMQQQQQQQGAVAGAQAPLFTGFQ